MLKRIFKLGKGEFGEVYHVAVACFLEPDKMQIYFEDFPIGAEFFELLKLPILLGPEPKKEETTHLGETANYIFDKYYPDCLKDKWTIIDQRAKDEKWEDSFNIIFNHCINSPERKVIIWARSQSYKPERNISAIGLNQLIDLCYKNNSSPVIMGSGTSFSSIKNIDYNFSKFYTNSFFDTNSIAKQLWCLDRLYDKAHVVATVGMMSGSIDGLAFFRHYRRSIFFAKKEDVSPRMYKISSVVPSLMWQEINYCTHFQNFSEADLKVLAKKIWFNII